MRKIKRTDGLNIQISHAGSNSEALTTVEIVMSLDGNKYFNGTNIIECLKDRLLPNLNVLAINQELTQNDIELIQGKMETGVFNVSTTPGFGGALYYLVVDDDAALGIVEFVPGEIHPVYT